MNSISRANDYRLKPSSSGRWPFWQARSSDFQDPLDLMLHRDVSVYLRVLAYMMEERPPVLRTDLAWARQTGKQSAASWRRSRQRLIDCGQLTSDERGLSAPRAELEWEVRDRISEQKSANSRGPGVARHKKAIGVGSKDLAQFPNDFKDHGEQLTVGRLELNENENEEQQHGCRSEVILIPVLDRMVNLPGRRQAIERILKPIVAARKFMSEVPEEALDYISLRLSELALSDEQCDAVVREVTSKRAVCVYVSHIEAAVNVVTQPPKSPSAGTVILRGDPLWRRIAEEYKKANQLTLLRIFEDSEQWPITVELLNRLREEHTDHEVQL